MVKPHGLFDKNLNANLEATTIRRRIYSIRPNSSGKYSLYADGYTISNIVNVVAYTSNMELTCTVSSYAGSLYLYIKKPDGTVYGNQDVTINVTYYGPVVS